MSNGWQPIETAPKDGTLMDIWAYRERIPDARFCIPHSYYNSATGKYATRPATFCSMEIVDIDGERGWDPIQAATHWMPRPAPPT